jgi:hypothetical protein
MRTPTGRQVYKAMGSALLRNDREKMKQIQKWIKANYDLSTDFLNLPKIDDGKNNTK